MSSQFSSLPRLPRTDRGGGRRPPSPLCFWVGGSGRIFSPFPSTGIPLSLFSFPPSFAESLLSARPKEKRIPLRRRRRYLDAGGGGGEMMPKYPPSTQIHFLLFTQQLRSLLLLLMMFPRLPPRLDSGGFLDPNYTTHAPVLPSPSSLRDASLAKIAIIPRSPLSPPPRQ